MNGARALLSTLAGAGVDVCFANPGTSELHLVAALDEVPAMRGVLCLFEGVATGAADGYGRVTGHPAATLLHLGPGLANGLANLHNARRARTPVLNLVGEHATGHARYDPPLNSDIASLARPVSGWYRASQHAEDLAADAADAMAAALGPPGCVATLVVPADVSWSGADLTPCPPRPRLQPPRVAVAAIEEAAASVRAGARTALLLGGSSLRARGLEAAARVAARTGATMLAETFPANLERGAGVAPVERLPYLGEMVLARLEEIDTLVLVDAVAPVSYFGYADRPSDLVPPGCRVQVLARAGEDAPGALEELAEAVSAPAQIAGGAPTPRPDRPTGPVTTESLAAALGATLPEQAIVVDEGNTAGLFVAGATAGAPRHDWLTLTGGAIGMGPPLATGAAVGAPRNASCASRPTAAPCTPSRRCGPRHARDSTSPPWCSRTRVTGSSTSSSVGSVRVPVARPPAGCWT